MAFLSFKSRVPELKRLPSGSFSVDSTGRIVTSTVPTSFPKEEIGRIAERVLKTFRRAHAAGMPLTELIIQYAAFKLTARELRGGAIVFLAPQQRG